MPHSIPGFVTIVKQMKLLKGNDLVDFIKVRQAQQVRRLRQAFYVAPRLVIIYTVNDPIIEKYMQLKRAYGADILIDVEIQKSTQENLAEAINEANADESVHGIIIQLPLEDSSHTQDILNLVDTKKDVDGLAKDSLFDPAAPMAVNWLLAGYNVDLRNRHLCIVGNGKLVGAPLSKIWQASGYLVTIVEKDDDLKDKLRTAEVIVSATGQPRLITSDVVPIGSIVVDAGSSDENGKQVGDTDPGLYDRDDLTITPQYGGVGPLTVAALFDNLIKACELRIKG